MKKTRTKHRLFKEMKVLDKVNRNSKHYQKMQNLLFKHCKENIDRK